MAMDSSLVNKERVGLSYAVDNGQAGFSYIGRAGKTVLSCLTSVVKKPGEIVGSLYRKGMDSSLARYAKEGVSYLSSKVQPVVHYAAQHPKAVKILAGSLAAYGLAYAIERAYDKLTNTQAVSAKKFKTALKEFLICHRIYELQVEYVVRRANFFGPMLVGAQALQPLSNKRLWSRSTEDALGASNIAFSLMRGVFGYAVDKCVRSLAYAPCTSWINTLRKRKLEADKKFEIVKQCIRDEQISMSDLQECPLDIAEKLYDYMSDLPIVPEKYQAKKQDFIGGIPSEVARVITKINLYNYVQSKLVEENVEETRQTEAKSNLIELPRGIFLLGDPGLGKSRMAQHIAFTTDCPIINVTGAELKNKWVGGSAEKVATIYEEAAKLAEQVNRPAIVFIDEADTILRDRESGQLESGTKDVQQEIMTMLFTYMDSPKVVKNVITIIASNMDQGFFDKAFITRTQRINYVIHMQYPLKDVVIEQVKFFAKQSPQTQELGEASNNVLEELLEARRHTRWFTPDSLKGLIKAAIDCATLRIEKSINEKYEPLLAAAKKQQDLDEKLENRLKKDFNEELLTRLNMLKVTKDDLEQALDEICARLPVRPKSIDDAVAETKKAQEQKDKAGGVPTPAATPAPVPAPVEPKPTVGLHGPELQQAIRQAILQAFQGLIPGQQTPGVQAPAASQQAHQQQAPVEQPEVAGHVHSSGLAGFDQKDTVSTDDGSSINATNFPVYTYYCE